MNVLILNNHYFIKELKELGHRVEYLGFGPESFNDPYQFCDIEKLFEKLPPNFKPDAIIYNDDSRPVKVFGLERLNIPTIFYSIDAHIHGSWHVHLGACCDHVFVAQKDYLPKFQELNSSSHWLPLWGPEVNPQLSDRNIDVCFRGNLDLGIHPERLPFFKKLSQLVNIDYGFGSFIDVYSNSKIVINELINNDLNFRVFEAMACGAMLMTPITTNGLLDLFEPEVDFVSYKSGDAGDAADKIKFYLKNEAARNKIAQNGNHKVKAYHLIKNRTQFIDEIMANSKSHNDKNKFIGAAVVYYMLAYQFRNHTKQTTNILLAQSIRSLLEYCNLGGNNITSIGTHLSIIAKLLNYSDDQITLDTCSTSIKYILSYFPPEMILSCLAVKIISRSSNPNDALQISQVHNKSVQDMIELADSVLGSVLKNSL